MRVDRACRAAIGLLRSRWGGVRLPLVVGMALTHRCQASCRYCGISRLNGPEMDEREALDIVRQLTDAGCMRIGFTGGEPLLRPDLPDLLRLCRRAGVTTTVTSNGVLVPERVDDLLQTDLLILSLDGPEGENDYLRGRGSFAAAVRAVQVAKRRDVPTAMSCVLTRANPGAIEFMLAFARKNDVAVQFQFVGEIPRTGLDIDPLRLTPEETETAVSALLAATRQGHHLLNSRRGLMRLKTGDRGLCASGKIFFRVSADARISACFRQKSPETIDLRKTPVRKAVRALAEPRCDQCDLADGVELSQLYQLDPRAIWHVIRRYG